MTRSAGVIEIDVDLHRMRGETGLIARISSNETNSCLDSYYSEFRNAPF